ncbi:MAG: hypothetical protein DMF28_07530 [Verrucomicrobia bacterium]|nr:MAG: hypothetical protein DMF28_07530 [Verrucomicrobiota bacterium]
MRMPPPFRAVIFDLDGVLADSEPWWNEIDKKLLGEYGVTYRGEYHRNVLGVSYRLAVEFYKKVFGLSAPTEELMGRRGEIAAEFFTKRVGLFPSTRAVLTELRQMNLRLAVATSSVGASARPFLDRHRLTAFFEVIVTGEEIESGIAAARAAGMRVAAVPDMRFVDPHDYEKEADYVLEDLSGILALICRPRLAN